MKLSYATLQSLKATKDEFLKTGLSSLTISDMLLDLSGLCA